MNKKMDKKYFDTLRLVPMNGQFFLFKVYGYDKDDELIIKETKLYDFDNLLYLIGFYINKEHRSYTPINNSVIADYIGFLLEDSEYPIIDYRFIRISRIEILYYDGNLLNEVFYPDTFKQEGNFLNILRQEAIEKRKQLELSAKNKNIYIDEDGIHWLKAYDLPLVKQVLANDRVFREDAPYVTWANKDIGFTTIACNNEYSIGDLVGYGIHIGEILDDDLFSKQVYYTEEDCIKYGNRLFVFRESD